MDNRTADTPAFEHALAFAAEKHAGQVRRGGLPYIVHPVAVADTVARWGYGRDHILAALFHDLLEDADATPDEIREIAGNRVLAAVEALTKRPGYVMADYVAGIRDNDIARVVKAADRLHNLQSAVLAPESFRRRYIAETREWYLDLTPEIPAAVDALEKTLAC